jgi:hypothetical protein
MDQVQIEERYGGLYARPGVDFTESFSPVATDPTIRIGID